MKRTPLRRRSKKRQAQYDEYIPRAKAFLEANPVCQICQVRPSQSVHHMQKRNGARLLDESKWMATCDLCNGQCEDDPAWAIAQGFKFRVNTHETPPRRQTQPGPGHGAEV